MHQILTCLCLCRPTQVRDHLQQTRWAQQEAPVAELSEALFQRGGAGCSRGDLAMTDLAKMARTTVLRRHLLATASFPLPLKCLPWHFCLVMQRDENRTGSKRAGGRLCLLHSSRPMTNHMSELARMARRTALLRARSLLVVVSFLRQEAWGHAMRLLLHHTCCCITPDPWTDYMHVVM